MDTPNLAAAIWRKSSYSGANGACVEVARLAHGVAVRNSNHPDTGTLHLTTTQTAALIRGTKAGLLDPHT